MNIELHEYKNELIELKHEYINKLNRIEEQIKVVQSQIYKQCAIKNKGHKWIREREEGMYGETFFYCEYCRCGE